jgi:hypothetical protein
MIDKVCEFATARKGRRCGSLIAAAVAVSFALSPAPAAAAVAYDEGVSGDLSNNGLAPTLISLGVGSNTISGTSGRDQAGVIDRDYFTFTLGANEALTAINVLQGTVPIGLSFIGVQTGNQVTVSPTTTTAAGLLGWTHYDASDVGTNILDDMGIAANGSTGFTGPLGPGTYAFWVQEASPGTATYAFDFVVAQAPEPSTWLMMLAGFGLAGVALRRGRRLQQAEAAA